MNIFDRYRYLLENRFRKVIVSKDMETFLLISAGAILGANLRYWVGGWAAGRFGASFPYGNLIINLTGSFILGFFITLATDRLLFDPRWRVLIVIGFLSSYTTFSSYTFESVALIMENQWLAGLREKTFGGWPENPGPLSVRPTLSVARSGVRLRAFEFSSQTGVKLRLFVAQRSGGRKPRRAQFTVLDQAAWLAWEHVMRASFAREMDALDSDSEGDGHFWESDGPEEADAERWEQLRESLVTGDTAIVWMAPRGIGIDPMVIIRQNAPDGQGRKPATDRGCRPCRIPAPPRRPIVPTAAATRSGCTWSPWRSPAS